MPRGTGAERIHKVIQRKVRDNVYYVMFLPKDWVTTYGVKKVKLVIEGEKITVTPLKE